MLSGIMLAALGTWAAAYRLRLGPYRRPPAWLLRLRASRPLAGPAALMQEIKRLPRWVWLSVACLAILVGMWIMSAGLAEMTSAEFSTNFPYAELAVPVQRPGSI